MFYSCELLEQHVKMSTEGFWNTVAFPETNCYKFSLWICLYPHPNRHSLPSFFSSPLCWIRASVFTVITPSWKGSSKIKYSFHILPEDWTKGVVLYWCAGRCQVFNLAAAVEGLISHPPGPVAGVYFLPSLLATTSTALFLCTPRMFLNGLSHRHISLRLDIIPL